MRVLPTVSLTGYQKILLAKIASAPESPQGGKRIHLNNDKLVNAQKFLARLNFITINNETDLVSLTDKAIILMREEGLIDEFGQITELGKQYAAGIIPKQNERTNFSYLKKQTPSMEKAHMSFKDYLALFET